MLHWSLTYWRNFALTITAVLTAIGMIYRWLVRPMYRGIKRTWQRIGQMADEFLGDEKSKPPVPSLPEQVRQLKTQLGEHVAEYHARPNGAGTAHARATRR